MVPCLVAGGVLLCSRLGSSHLTRARTCIQNGGPGAGVVPSSDWRTAGLMVGGCRGVGGTAGRLWLRGRALPTWHLRSGVGGGSLAAGPGTGSRLGSEGILVLLGPAGGKGLLTAWGGVKSGEG